MGTTTKMAIPYPEATGLVKDGWEDMKDIATQVDAKSGLVLLNTTSFSGVASQSVNNVFSSTFDNYRLLITIDSTTATAQQTFSIKLRAGGTDKSTGYDYNQARQYSSTITYLSGTSQSSFPIGFLSTTINGSSFFVIDICDPNVSKHTRMFSNSTYAGDSVRDMLTGGCVQADAYQADGFNLIIGGNAVTGEVSTYGYNK